MAVMFQLSGSKGTFHSEGVGHLLWMWLLSQSRWIRSANDCSSAGSSPVCLWNPEESETPSSSSCRCRRDTLLSFKVLQLSVAFTWRCVENWLRFCTEGKGKKKKVLLGIRSFSLQLLLLESFCVRAQQVQTSSDHLTAPCNGVPEDKTCFCFHRAGKKK